MHGGPVETTSSDGNRQDIIRKVRHTLNLAQAAVAKDEEGHLDAALEIYEKLVSEMDEVSRCRLPAELHAAYLAQKERYTERMAVLQSHRHDLLLTRPKRMSQVPFMDTMSDMKASEGASAKDAGALSLWEPEPENALRRPFWLLRLIKSTINTGGYLTSKLHVPKLVWEQDGARFTGLSSKMDAFKSALLLIIDRIKPLEYPTIGGDVKVAKRALLHFSSVREGFDQIQNNLARPFPFIREVPEGVPPDDWGGHKAGGGPLPPPGGGGGALVGMMQQRLGSVVSAIGKTVVKSAATAYERLGASVPGKISDEDLTHYASLVAELCDKCQALDEWYDKLEGIRKELQDRKLGEQQPPGDQALYPVVEDILVQLLQIARFLQEVVCELVLRDLELLLDRYLKKMRKSFARMHWDVIEEET